MAHVAATPSPLSWFAKIAGWCGLIPAAVVAVAVLASPWSWVGDLGTPWSTHAAVLLLVPLVLWRRRWKLASAVTVLFIVLLLPRMTSAWVPRAVPIAEPTQRMSVAAVNVFKDNPLRAGDVPELAALDVEVLGLIEIDEGDEDSLRHDPRWPHQHWAHNAEGDQRGVGNAILSRHPLGEVTVHQLLSDVLIDAVVQRDGADIRVFVIHTMPPLTAAHSNLRTRQIERIARLAQASELPVVAMGDWNCTPACRAWAPLTHGGLLRARGSTAATWPAALGPVGIAIDHVLVRGADIVETRVEAISGSDHRLVEALIGW